MFGLGLKSPYSALQARDAETPVRAPFRPPRAVLEAFRGILTVAGAVETGSSGEYRASAETMGVTVVYLYKSLT